MKRFFTLTISVLFALVLVFSTVIPAFAANEIKYVYADDGLLSKDKQSALEAQCKKFSEDKNVLILIAYFKGDYSKEELEKVATDYYNKTYKNNKLDYMLFSLSLTLDGEGNPNWGLPVIIYDESKHKEDITAGIADRMVNDMYESYNEDKTPEELLSEIGMSFCGEAYNYFAGAVSYEVSTNAAGEKVVTPVRNKDYTYYQGEIDENGNVVMSKESSLSHEMGQFHWVRNIAIALVLGLLIGLIAVSVMKSKLKSVVKQSGAANYIVSDSFVLDTKNDIFLYKKVDKQEKVQQQTQKK